MLAGGYSWRLYFYVEIAFAGVLLIIAFFVVEETMYDRKSMVSTIAPTAENGSTSDSKEVHAQHSENENHTTAIPERKSFISTLKPWSRIDHRAEFFMTMIRPFSYFVVPAVFWVITTYGLSPFPSFPTRRFLTSIQAYILVSERWHSTTPSPSKSLRPPTPGSRKTAAS